MVDSLQGEELWAVLKMHQDLLQQLRHGEDFIGSFEAAGRVRGLCRCQQDKVHGLIVMTIYLYVAHSRIRFYQP